ncbi:MAG TPA: carbon-nitrogen hydrolase family protein [Thermoanaerobaculia bacterium]
MTRVRVASLQYYIRPVSSWGEFRDQVASLVATAADYGCQLVVFPEYFTVQLLTLEEVEEVTPQQIRRLADQVPRYVDLFTGLARKHRLHIVAGSIPLADDGRLTNRSFVFGPGGDHGVQGKLHMTRWEREEWHVEGSESLRLFDTGWGRIAVNICYDVEFPEIARAAARQGAEILVVPSCTDDRQGFLRVRYCAQARCIENQLYAVQSCTVGSLPMVPAVSLNYGQAAILTPSDFTFSRDGILAEGVPNQESMIIGDLNLDLIREARESGTVLPLRDSQHTAEVVANTEIVELLPPAGEGDEGPARGSAPRGKAGG